MIGCICICLRQVLVEPFRGQPCQAPVCKHNMASASAGGLVPAHGIDPKLGQSLDDFSFSLCFIFVPAFLFDRDNSGSKFLRRVHGPIPQLATMSIYWKWSFNVLSPHCWTFRLLGASHIPGVWGFPEVLLVPHCTLMHISISSSGSMNFSPVSHHT
jgi:hypothetical protein